MKRYRVIKKRIELEVSENELFAIAEHWVDEANEYILEQEEWEYPNDISQVEEILIEYMQCEITELDSDEIYRDTHDLYVTLT